MYKVAVQQNYGPIYQMPTVMNGDNALFSVKVL